MSIDASADAGSDLARLRHHQDLPGSFEEKSTQTRSPPTSPQAINGPRSSEKRLPWPVFLFLCSLVIPWVVTIGPVALSVPRLIILAMIFPCLARWVGGAAGRIRAADIALLLFCLWSALSLIVVHGTTLAIEPAAILFIETMGAYLLARCYVRDADDFLKMTRMLFKIVVFLFPFALIEAVTGRNVLLEIFAAILPSYPDAGDDVRGGLWRVQVVFQHPILFGICAGSAFALTHLVLGHGVPPFQRWRKTALVGATALLSLSSAPIAAIIVQAALMIWNWLLRNSSYRWKLLWGLFLVSYLVVEFGSNQTPVEFYISHFTFDPHTGWHRLLIWDYGSASVLNHPLFGVGFGDWARASWMSSSVDMFWLVNAMRYGIPAGLLIVLAFFSLFLAIGFQKGLNARLLAYRTAYLIVMMAFFLVGWTVHFWGMAYLWFLFLLGSGAWLLDVQIDGRATSSGSIQPHRIGRPSQSAEVAHSESLARRGAAPIQRR